MKYSFLFPYYKRESFKSTLISFCHHYTGRDDYEVVVIEDSVNKESAEDHDRLMKIIEEFKGKMHIVYCTDDLRSYNSAKKYNIGFKSSSGQFIILSNPETFHVANILSGLDDEFSKNPYNYIICSCRSATFEKQIVDEFNDYKKSAWNIWYQHSIDNNRMLHFCSAISRENFARVGGFDEKYCKGIAYEDNSFLARVQMNTIPIILRDDLVTFHIDHSRQYLHENHDLYKINENLWIHQLKTNDFFEKFI